MESSVTKKEIHSRATKSTQALILSIDSVFKKAAEVDIVREVQEQNENEQEEQFTVPTLIDSLNAVAPKEVFDKADELEAERKKLEAAAPKKRRASDLLRAMR
ncbi:hypothetical protein ACJJTC_011429 [Scirpophaga incertulas]